MLHTVLQSAPKLRTVLFPCAEGTVPRHADEARTEAKSEGDLLLPRVIHLHQPFPKSLVGMVMARFKLSWLVCATDHSSRLYLSKDKSLFSVLPKEKSKRQARSEIHCGFRRRDVARPPISIQSNFVIARFKSSVESMQAI